MKTTCTIKWPNGKALVAIVVNQTSMDHDPVKWSGDLSRLEGVTKRDVYRSSGLEAFCDDLAERTHGVLTVTHEGTFENFENLIGPDGEVL